MFSPPLHRQRHQFVVEFVRKNKPKKVVDLGCSECVLLNSLRFCCDVELLVGVDVNGTKIKQKMRGLAPLPADYLQPGPSQLRVDLYQGSVTEKDPRLRGFDLATSIELIEHLHPPDVQLFTDVLFGFMAPVTVIISTPNSDFNPLLPGLTGFRHADHKFEWSRAEFQSWALTVCLEFGYEVEFTGVGEAPPWQQQGLGYCSQIAVFHRLGVRDASCGEGAEGVLSYTLLYSINYPSLQDNNILQRVLVGEVLYWAEKLKRGWLEEKEGGAEAAAAGGGGGGGEEYVSEPRLNMEEEQTEAACGGELRSGVEECVSGVSEDEGGASAPSRCVSVPLSVLWLHCPRLRSLSGSPWNLRRLLTDSPGVDLSQDGSAVLLCNQRPGDLEDLEDLEDQEEPDDSSYTEVSHSFTSAVDREDWENWEDV